MQTSDRGYWHLETGFEAVRCVTVVRVSEDLCLSGAVIEGLLEVSHRALGVLRLSQHVNHSAQECPYEQ